MSLKVKVFFHGCSEIVHIIKHKDFLNKTLCIFFAKKKSLDCLILLNITEIELNLKFSSLRFEKNKEINSSQKEITVHFKLILIVPVIL